MSQEVLERGLLLADKLLRAAATLGWMFDDPLELRKKQGKTVADVGTPASPGDSKEAPEPYKGRLLVEGEQVVLLVEERLRDEVVEATAAQLAREKREYGYYAPRKKMLVPTGALRIVRLDTYRNWGGPDRRSRYDRKGGRVEDQIPEVLLGFYELALSIRERWEKDEREAREREEQECRRKEREAILEANQELIAQLERDAGAWHRARYLRTYVCAARQSLGTRALTAIFRDKTINYLDWAERYIDQLDSLNRAGRTGEFEEGSSYHFQNDLDRMKKAFGRLLGGDWPDAWKIGLRSRFCRRSG